MRIALLTNIPAPYRVPVFDRIAGVLGDDFHVFYLARQETNRRWQAPHLRHGHTYLAGIEIPRSRGVAHINVGVVRALRRFAPDVILTSGANAAMIAAWLYARAAGLAHVACSDSWLFAEHGQSALHRLLRKAVYSSSRAYVGASEKTLELFRAYGARDNLFVAPLCIDNSAFAPRVDPPIPRSFDLVFAGRLVPDKMPRFFVDVVRAVARWRPVRVLMIGDGELRATLERELRAITDVEAELTGFLQQAHLPRAYARGKVFCFPTVRDAWGVVANEACAAGLPVLTCDQAGCAHELVRHDINGYVLPLDAEIWAEHAERLLRDQALWETMSKHALEVVASYTYDAAARGFLAAVRSCATTSHSPEP